MTLRSRPSNRCADFSKARRLWSFALTADRYAWVQTTLLRFHYLQLSKADKGVLLSFLQKISGYSRIQVKRLDDRINPRSIGANVRGLIEELGADLLERLCNADDQWVIRKKA